MPQVINTLPIRNCIKCGRPFVGYAICPACQKLINDAYAKMMAEQKGKKK